MQIMDIVIKMILFLNITTCKHSVVDIQNKSMTLKIITIIYELRSICLNSNFFKLIQYTKRFFSFLLDHN